MFECWRQRVDPIVRERGAIAFINQSSESSQPRWRDCRPEGLYSGDAAGVERVLDATLPTCIAARISLRSTDANDRRSPVDRAAE